MCKMIYDVYSVHISLRDYDVSWIFYGYKTPMYKYTHKKWICDISGAGSIFSGIWNLYVL